jgi:hypothetical protein
LPKIEKTLSRRKGVLTSFRIEPNQREHSLKSRFFPLDFSLRFLDVA